ncbi:MAG: DUF2155 domain-containing protein [Hyphomicrobiaceae bacterium]
MSSHNKSHTRLICGWLAGAMLLLAMPAPAHAQRIDNGKAVFAALDKVTARIQRLEARVGETVKFGSLKLTVRACYSRAPTEPPKTSTFVQIDETKLDGKSQRIFSGWMFAESPGLNAVEHPVYDVWLTECAEPKNAVAAPVAARKGDEEAPSEVQPPPRRFRPRR